MRSIFAAVVVAIGLTGCAGALPTSSVFPHVEQAEKPYRAAIDYCDRNPEMCRNGSQERVELTSRRWRELAYANRVGNAWNYRDEKFDYWIDTGGGDCEDFALSKRRMLIERFDWPSSALVLATARRVPKRAGDPVEKKNHVVLIARTDAGDYVLDTDQPSPVPWRETCFRWKHVQSADDFTRFHRAGASNAGADTMCSPYQKRRLSDISDVF